MNPVVRLSSFLLVVGLLARGATAQPAGEPSPAEMVKRADTDGNGRLSLAEFVKARTAMIEQYFARMDTDGDGMLDEKEVAAAAEQMRSMAGAGRGGFRRPEGQRPQRPGAEQAQRPEGQRPGAAGLGDAAFGRLDRDGNGSLSREEFEEGMARMRQYMQQGGGRPGSPDRGERGPDQGFRRPPEDK
jgi:hypothetical protein